MDVTKTTKAIKKMMMRTEDGIVYIDTALGGKSYSRTAQGNHVEGLGNGYTDSIIISGSNDVYVESSVCTLKGFTGRLKAKNSQVYVDSASGEIELEHSSLDIIGLCSSKIKGVNSYIKIDDFFNQFTGSAELELNSVYIGPSEKLTKDDTTAVKDPLAGAIAALTVSGVFDKEKVLIGDYRSLEGRPKISLGASEVFRVNDRYIMIELAQGKTSRVKSWQEVFVKYDDGITLVDSTGSLIYRKH